MPSLYDASREDIAGLMPDQPAYRSRQVWRALNACRRPEEMTDLPAPLRSRLGAALPPALKQVTATTADDGETVKWLWELADGAQVETVLMHYPERSTVCVSSQAGCAMGCQFCATGQGGFKRHLTPGEIVEQVVVAARSAASRSRRVSNVVFMGMGEPFANYERWWAAVRRLNDDLGIAARHLTVSTVGIVPGIRKLAASDLQVNLAVSLHAANDELRSELIPIASRYPLDVLAEACGEYIAATGRRLSFEWAVIDGVNDRGSDVDELATFARPLRAHVNLIPLNPTPEYPTPGSPIARVRAMRDQLRERGVNATVRDNRGTSIDAACGQLAASTLRP